MERLQLAVINRRLVSLLETGLPEEVAFKYIQMMILYDFIRGIISVDV